MAGNKTLHVAFCHPDLGLGGAERLVVDAACELCNHGHKVLCQPCDGFPVPCTVLQHCEGL